MFWILLSASLSRVFGFYFVIVRSPREIPSFADAGSDIDGPAVCGMYTHAAPVDY